MSFDENRIPWEKAEEFVSESGIVVEVNRLPLRTPKFSIIVSAKFERNGGSGRGRFIPVRYSGQGKIILDNSIFELRELLEQAEKYIHDEAQRAEDERITTKEARERHDLDKGKSKPKKGIKSWGKDDKARRVTREE